MNILILAHYQDDGSPYVSFVHNQAIEFVRQGHKVTVIAPTVLGKKYKFLEKRKHHIIDGVSIYYIDCLSFSNFGKYTFNNWFGYIAVKNFFNKLMKKEAVDIIHAHTIGFDGYIGGRLKVKYGIPLVLTTHGSDTIMELDQGRGRQVVRICKKADIVVAVSSMLRKRLLSECSLLDIRVILNGFVKEPVLYKEKEPYTVLQVSSLIKRKKTDVTIQAFAKVLNRFPQASLGIIGEGTEKAELVRICRELQIEKSVYFYGHLSNEDVLKHMAQTQVFVMPSVNEGFGIVYLEAMSQKCAVIGTNGEGIMDIIEGGENGILISPDDVDGLAEKIEKCFRNSKYYKKISVNGFETAQELTWENNARKYLQLFQTIISGKMR